MRPVIFHWSAHRQTFLCSDWLSFQVHPEAFWSATVENAPWKSKMTWEVFNPITGFKIVFFFLNNPTIFPFTNSSSVCVSQSTDKPILPVSHGVYEPLCVRLFCGRMPRMKQRHVHAHARTYPIRQSDDDVLIIVVRGRCREAGAEPNTLLGKHWAVSYLSAAHRAKLSPPITRRCRHKADLWMEVVANASFSTGWLWIGRRSD